MQPLSLLDCSGALKMVRVTCRLDGEITTKSVLCQGRCSARPAACKVLCTVLSCPQPPAQQSCSTPGAWWAVSAYTRRQDAQRLCSDGSCLVHACSAVMPRHGAVGCISLHCVACQEQHSTAAQQQCGQVGTASHRHRCTPATASEGTTLSSTHTTHQQSPHTPCHQTCATSSCMPTAT